MGSRRARGPAAGAGEDVEAAFARVLVAEEEAELAVRACQVRADALHDEVAQALHGLAARAAARRARRIESDAAAEADELRRLEQARAAAELSVELDAEDRSRLARAVAQLAAELCGGDAG